MATTEEIVAKYRLDLDDLKAQVGDLEKTYGKADAAAKKSADESSKAFGKFGDSLKDLGKTLVAAFAVERIVAFGKASVQAYADAEKGALKLKAAVSASGGLAQDFDKLTAQAEELAGITIFDDDQIKAAQTLALQFGLNSAAVSKLIPKVADFAAATGQDLQQALQTVLAGINGQTEGLKRYGFELDTGATRNERFAATVEQLTTKFDGQAQALTSTLGGSLGQAQKAFDELQETVGKALAPAVTSAAEAVTGFFTALQGAPTDPLVNEIAGLETYRQKLFDVNTTQTERATLIEELKTKYPGYLEFLNKDKATNEQLNTALNKVTNELVDQLVLKQQTAKVEEKQQAVNDARAVVAEKEAKVAELLAQARTKGIQVEDKYVSVVDRARRAVELLTAKAKDSSFGTKAVLNALATNLEQTALGIGTFSDGLVQSYDEVKKAEKSLGEQQKTRTEVIKELGLETKTTAETTTAATKTGLEAQTEAEKKAAEAAAAAAKKAAADKAKAAADAAAKQAADELKVRDQLAKDGLQQDLDNLKLYQQEQERGLKEKFDKENTANKAAAAEQQATLLQQLQQGLISYEDYEKKKAAIAAAVPDLTKQQTLEEAKLQLSGLELQRQNMLDYGADVRDIDQQILDQKTKVQEAQTALDEKGTADRIALTEEEAKAQEEALKKQEEARKYSRERTLELATQLEQQLVTLSNNITEQQITDLTKRRDEQTAAYDEEQAALDEQLQKRLISQAEYEGQSAAIKNKRAESEKAVNDKINALKKRQDTLQKAQALFSIGVDTAKAIQAQLALTPFPAGAFFVALIAASGLAQAGAVLAQKPPQYADGIDYVPLGGNRPGRDTIPAWLDQGERVISRRKNLDNWDLYQAIDQGKLDEYVFKQYTLPALLAERAKGGPVVQALGALLSGSGAASGGLDATDLRRALRRGVPITNLDELAELLTRSQPSPYRA